MRAPNPSAPGKHDTPAPGCGMRRLALLSAVAVSLQMLVIGGRLPGPTSLR